LAERSPRLARLTAFHGSRDPERVALKYARLRRDPFSFLRGTNVLFQEDWALAAGVLRNGPLAWHCGDLHAENIGSFRGGNRLTYFDLTDFDDAILAPVLLDITRLCTSVIVAGDVYGPAFDGRVLAEHLLASYRRTLRSGKAWWVERATATGLVRDLLRGLRARRRRDFLASRVRLTRRTIRTDTGHAAAAPVEEQHAVAAAVHASLSRHAPELVVHHVARRIAGNGSLGVPRWVLLVEQAVPDTRLLLLDAKVPSPSPALMHAPVQPRWRSDAERVVTVQQLMQAAPPALLHEVPFGDTALVVRELQPSEDRVQLDAAMARPRALRRLLEQMAEIHAWGQLRASGWHGASAGEALQTFAERDDWEGEVLAYAVRAATTVRQDWQAFVDAT
jgi:uncharacterized protein (DUF2252 family)